MTRIAIIGAGLAGLSAAKRLNGKADVSVFEKSRGMSGRMSTRYVGAYAFDHGAQYFTIKSDAFRRFLEPYMASGLVVPWVANLVTLKPDGVVVPYISSRENYVAAPHMNALGKAVAQDLNVHTGTQITHVRSNHKTWMLEDESGTLQGPFDWVISAAPAPQTAKLMPAQFRHHAALSKVSMQGCFTLMLEFEDKPKLDWQGAFVEASPVGWIALNSTKPDRAANHCLVIQSTNEWAQAHLEDDKDAVMAKLLDEAAKRMGLIFDNPLYKSLHRWRYANVVQGAGEAFLLDEDARLAACGDWCLKGRVEAAFQSGDALASRLGGDK